MQTIEAIQELINQYPDRLRGAISDGYHTFNELYEHRCVLFAALVNLLQETVGADRGIACYKSRLHSDGIGYDGWFVLGMAAPEGQITYHLPDRLWDLCKCPALEKAPPFDGHTSDDVLNRLTALFLEN